MNDLKKRFELSKKKKELFKLTIEDSKIIIDNTGKEIKSIDDLVMVHVTNYLPEGKIKTPLSTKRYEDRESGCILNGIRYNYPVRMYHYRNSIHFCLNAGVENHPLRYVKKNKYAILMPLNNNKDKIIAGSECDLFTEGDVEIKEDAYILCTEEELENIKKYNPNATIIVCEGDCVDPYINIFLSEVLGYKYKKPTQQSRVWDEGKGADHDKAKNIIEENKWQYTSQHYGSLWSENEHTNMYLDYLFAFLKIIKDNNVLYDRKNMDEVLRYINENNLILARYKENLLIINNRLYNALGISFETIINECKEKNIVEILDEISFTLVEELRKKSLEEKIELGIASEIEEIEFLCNQNKIDYRQIENSKNKEFINKIEELKNKKLDDLNHEEVKTVISYINLKNNIIGNNYKLRIDYIDFDENEKINKESIKILFNDQLEIVELLCSQIGITLEEFYEICNNNYLNFESLYEISKKINEIPNSHIDMQLTSAGTFSLSTDYEATKANTVIDLIRYATNYVYFFNRLYSGENISFDKYGNAQEYIIYNNEEKNTNMSL